MRRTGLALGGGAVLGAAHVGVMRAFEELEIPLQCISGTSIGALVASLYAFGLNSGEIAKLEDRLSWLDFPRLSLSRLGLLTNDRIGHLLDKAIGKVNIEDAPLPLAIIATDVSTGERVVFREGPVALAVMASTCVPGVFKPIIHEGRYLIDGGLVENVPVSPLKSMGAGTIVGVDLNANRRYGPPEDLIDVLANAIDIAIDHSARVQAKGVDVTIAPDLNAFSRTDVDAVADLVQAGYQAAKHDLTEAFFFEV